MKQPFRYLMLLSAITLPAATFAEVSEDQVQALEARITQLEAENAAGSASTDKGTQLKINGFMSVGATYLDDDTVVYDAGLMSQEWDWRNTSRAGLQFDMRINDKVNAVTQLQAYGREGYVPTMSLAYISYRPAANDELRAGRQRLPVFMLSEYLDIGYAYPWAKPPVESYGTLFPSNYEGISWIHRVNSERWSHEVQAFFGDMLFDFPGQIHADVNDLIGISWLGTYSDWTFRAAYAGSTRTTGVVGDPVLGTLITAAGAQMNDSEVAFAGVGAQYDNGSLLVMSEFTSIVADGFYPDTDSSYLTLGWRFGKFLPTLTVAEVKVTDKSDRNIPALPFYCPGVACLDDSSFFAGDGTIPFPADTLNKFIDAEQQTVTLGIRYDFLPNTSVKFDVTQVIDTGDGWGNTTPLDSNGFAGNVDEQLFGKPDTPIYAYRLILDVVF